jgi:uncharacterized NAD(P)/FAD-binding protein YdhS
MNKESSHKVYDIIIVGAGYSGTLVAVQLARAQANLRIALIERGKNTSRGIAYGFLAPDPLRIGAHSGQDGRLIYQTGEPIDGLYTLGSPRMGLLYESIAVPELRGQAAALAKCILRNDK